MHNIVEQCAAVGLVSGKHLAVDGTKVRANASIKSLEPLVVEVDLDDYLCSLKLKENDKPCNNKVSGSDDKNFRGTKLSNKTHRSTTDPDARLYRKSSGQETSLSYVVNDLIDTKSRVILATTVTQPGITTERDAALEMLDTLEKNGLSKNIRTLTADQGNGETGFITDIIDRGITPHIPLLAKDTYEAEPSWITNTYIPQRLQKRVHKAKGVAARNHVRKLAQTPEYKLSQKRRKRVEHIFAEAKNWHGLERARSRGIQAMQQQACLTATVQNIKRIVGHMRRKFRNTGVAACKTPVINALDSLNRSFCTTLRNLLRHFRIVAAVR